MTQAIFSAIKSSIAQQFQNVNGVEDPERRGMPLLAGQVLHPIIEDASSIKTQTIPAQQGRRAVQFLYVDTREGVRLTATQITRRGNGINLNAGTMAAAFGEWVERVVTHPTYAITVDQLLSRPGTNGMQHNAVFLEALGDEAKLTK